MSRMPEGWNAEASATSVGTCEGSDVRAMAPLTGERLFQALGDCAYELDPAFRVVTYNEGCERYYGVPASEALGRSIFDALPETRSSPLEPLLRLAMAERHPLRVEMGGIV